MSLSAIYELAKPVLPITCFYSIIKLLRSNRRQLLGFARYHAEISTWTMWSLSVRYVVVCVYISENKASDRLTFAHILVFSGLLFACGAQPKRSNSAAIEDAQARLVAGDWADAAQRFDKLANQHNRADLFLAAAQAYCHLGQNGVCEARLAAAARLAPTDKRVLLAISRAIKFEAPKTQLQDSKGTPNAASFWSQRAREKVQKSNISSALSDLEVATGIDEKRLQDWVLLGHLARKMNRR